MGRVIARSGCGITVGPLTHLSEAELVDRGKKIEVLRLAQRIAAELESGRVDDVDMDDETVARVAAMLAPRTPILYRPPQLRIPSRLVNRKRAQLTA